MKPYYRIELYEGADYVCKNVALAAARANGGQNISLNDLKTIVDVEKIANPSLHDDITAEIIGESILHIDRNRGREWQTVCRIEMVEIVGLTQN